MMLAPCCNSVPVGRWNVFSSSYWQIMSYPELKQLVRQPNRNNVPLINAHQRLVSVTVTLVPSIFNDWELSHGIEQAQHFSYMWRHKGRHLLTDAPRVRPQFLPALQHNNGRYVAYKMSKPVWMMDYCMRLICYSVPFLERWFRFGVVWARLWIVICSWLYIR